MQNYEAEALCISQPVNVAHNVTFLVHNRLLKSLDDIKFDNMVVWKQMGSPTKWFFAKRDENNVVTDN